MRIELIYAPECPLTGQTRVAVQRCLDRLGLHVPVEEAAEGDRPSPTVLVGGVDVMGQPAVSGRSCRLDVPTEDRIMAALRDPTGHGTSARDQKGAPDAEATRTGSQRQVSTER